MTKPSQRPRRSLPRRIVRWTIRLCAGAVVLTLMALLAGWLVVRASLPTLDGRVLVAGLDASVTIERDARGIPTIRAASWLDAVRAQGFVHAQDRFFQMDLTRRAAAGELAGASQPRFLGACGRTVWHSNYI